MSILFNSIFPPDLNESKLRAFIKSHHRFATRSIIHNIGMRQFNKRPRPSKSKRCHYICLKAHRKQLQIGGGGGGGAHRNFFWGGGTHNFFFYLFIYYFFFFFFLGGGAYLCKLLGGGGGTAPRAPPIPTAL